MARAKVVVSLFLAAFVAVALGSGCKSRHRSLPKAADSGPATGAAKTAPKTAPKAVPGPDAGKAEAATDARVIHATATGAGPKAAAAKGDERKRLWDCYQEVYCAQKKGEMDKILGIYKKYGFDTPKQFTAAWTEAAKDTDWLSRLAHDVSKKCK